ncbi:autophagy-related protein 22-like protein [Scleroderma yunnanense]
MSLLPVRAELASADERDPVVSVSKLFLSDARDTGNRNILITSGDTDEPPVTRKELWSYYLYSNGDCGTGPGYTQILFQNLATAAGYDPVTGPGSSCTAPEASGQCVLPWGSGTKPVASIVLLANGVGFATMAVIFTTIGSAGDYGTCGRWILFVVTILCWGSQYACMALTSPTRWRIAMVLYILSFVTYGASLIFYAAAFPRLARNTPYLRKLREKYESGEVCAEEYERVHNNVGYVATSALNLALLLPLVTATNPRVDNFVLALDNTYWVLLGVWWFIYQLPRPGPPLPKGEYYFTIGWKQIWAALKTYKDLPYTFLYLFAIFLLADGLNTTGTLVAICQNAKFNFSFLTLTYLGLSQAISSVISTFVFWRIQRHWQISTKKMLFVTNVVTILIPLWGIIGIWTNRIGFHQAWEFWAYNIVFGLFQASYYAFAQTMMAELSPPGFDNMFFGLFGLSNRSSSMVGPIVIQSIIEKTGNNWQGFPFLFALCTAASLTIWFCLDVKRGRRDSLKWAALQRSAVKE